jgi:hypothetical protein
MKYVCLIAALLAAGVVGCNDDTTGISKSWTNGIKFTSSLAPTIENIWPNDDQTAWSYDYVLRVKDGWSQAVYDSLDDVPPLPDWGDVSRFLDMRLSGRDVYRTAATYGMRFDGQKTSGAGVTAQNLEVTVAVGDEGAAALSKAAPAHNEFLTRLYLARPDLRPKLAHLLAHPVADVPPAIWTPIFVHGGVWEKTARWIGTYGDIDQLLAWKFLTDDLSPGSEFTHQLVPSVADDIFLHCRIVGWKRIETDVGRFARALDCLYLVDYGVSSPFTPEGHPTTGYVRSFSYGRVTYAPTVGPAYCHERPMADAKDPVGEADMVLILRDFVPPAPGLMPGQARPLDEEKAARRVRRPAAF